MPHILKNNFLEVLIDDPLENYNSARFDWTGKITQVLYQGIPFTTSEIVHGNKDNGYGKGLYNEFGIKTALGFKEAEVGEWFHKIGIGLLKKGSKKYKFSNNYEIKPAKFQVTVEEDKISINCISDSLNGFSYLLKKVISLKEDCLEISYFLENTGSKIIETDEYAHNFLSINNSPIQTDYVLSFPFQLKPEVFGKTVNKEGKIDFIQNKVIFNDHPKEPFFFNRLSGKNPIQAEWELIHLNHKVGVREVVNFKAKKVTIWGSSHVISPELYHSLHIKPSENAHWKRSYFFFQIP